jgi:hypothetical protein
MKIPRRRRSPDYQPCLGKKLLSEVVPERLISDGKAGVAEAPGNSQCIMRERPVFGMRGWEGSSRKFSERMTLYLEGKSCGERE